KCHTAVGPKLSDHRIGRNSRHHRNAMNSKLRVANSLDVHTIQVNGFAWIREPDQKRSSLFHGQVRERRSRE
ncbi:MAG: hypothetical protein ACKO23_18400, partial [Gemmataceae bacterium]